MSEKKVQDIAGEYSSLSVGGNCPVGSFASTVGFVIIIYLCEDLIRRS